MLFLGLPRTSDFCLRDCFVTLVFSIMLRRDNVRAPPYIFLGRTRVLSVLRICMEIRARYDVTTSIHILKNGQK